MIISNDHPFFFLQSLFLKHDAVFNLSKYIYKTDTLFDDRESLSIQSSELTLEWVEDIINSLNPEQELAFHSKVKIKNKIFHIPMIDFAIANNLNNEVIDRIRNFIPKKISRNFVFFRSGKSFHAYSTTLVTYNEWLDFMGRLLLINLPNDSQIIDTRWIGHRLINRFASLRWSNNSGKYVIMPHQINVLI